MWYAHSCSHYFLAHANGQVQQGDGEKNILERCGYGSNVWVNGVQYGRGGEVDERVEVVATFRYLGGTLDQTDDNWPAV